MSFGTDQNLIPFGVEKDTGEVLDVGEAKQGRACNCLCPACQTPLIARHGDSNAWHFAHESRGTYEQTRDACGLSLFVSLKLMARQLLKAANAMQLPSFTVSRDVRGTRLADTVTPAKRIGFDQIEIEQHLHGIAVDALITIPSKSGAAFQLGIVLTYPGHDFPVFELLLSSEHAAISGLIEIDLQRIWAHFATLKKGYREALNQLLIDDPSSKQWHSHPRLAAVKAKLDASASSALALQPQLPARIGAYSGDVNQARYFGCTGCNVRWIGVIASTIYCLQCREPGRVVVIGPANSREDWGLRAWNRS